MADMATAGQSNGRIAAWLNAEDVRPPYGGYEWTPEVVRVMLRSPSLAGRMVAKGKVVRDDDGTVIMHTADPILSGEKWDVLQAEMDKRGQHHRERKQSHQLLRVAFCGPCGTGHARGPAPLYGHAGQGRGKRDVYKCQRCHGPAVLKTELEAELERQLLEQIGDRKVPRKVVIPAIDHTSELAEVRASIEDIRQLVVSGQMPARSAATMLTALEQREDELAAKPQRAAKTTYERTPETVSERWNAMDYDERGAFLRSWGFRAIVHGKDVYVIFPWDHTDIDTEGLAEAFGIGA
jgi:hypothetical protein